MSDKEQNGNALVPAASVRGLLAVQGGTSPIPTPEEIQGLTTLASWTFRARTFPQYPSAESVFVGLCWMREMGISMMMGLSKGYVVKGKFDVEAKVKLASIKAKIHTFEYEFPESNDKRCVFRARLLPTDKWTETEYTIERAKAAGYTKNRDGVEDPTDVWQSNRAEMLQWRAITRWINLYAGHVIYSVGGLVAVDALENERKDLGEAVEVVEWKTQIMEPAPASAVSPKSERTPPPLALPDWKAEWVRIAKLQGYPSGRGSGHKLLELANLLMQHLGFKAVRSSTELSPIDYKNMVGEMQKRGWDREGTGTPREAAKEPAAPQRMIPAKGFDEQHADRTLLPGPLSVSAEEDEPEPEPEVESEEMTLEVAAASGDVSSIIALGNKTSLVMKTDGSISRTFVQEYPIESGNWWFVDLDILQACGESISAEGKQTGAPVLLDTPSEMDKEQIGSDGLIRMLGQKLAETAAEFEARNRGKLNQMSARSQAALETSRRKA
jgi:hypothetical protein